jgi:hypothetical protein
MAKKEQKIELVNPLLNQLDKIGFGFPQSKSQGNSG